MTAGFFSLFRLRRGIPTGFAILSSLLFLPVSPSVLAQSEASPRQSSAAIRTPDFDESVRWYRDKLGFRLVTTQDFVQGRSAVMERSGSLLEITEVDHLLQPDPDSPAGDSTDVTPVPVLSVLVPDVDKEIEQLRKADVDVLQDPADELNGRYRTAHIRDNGRHRIELREPIDEHGFNAMGR